MTFTRSTETWLPKGPLLWPGLGGGGGLPHQGQTPSESQLRAFCLCHHL